MSEHVEISDDRGNVTLEQLIEELIRTPEQQQTFLRTGWIHTIMMQLIDARFEAGLTQKELGERMGKQQSAIARLERWDDIKLSTLFDYLAALGLSPAGEIPVKSYTEALHSQFPRTADEAGVKANADESSAPTVLAAD